MRSVLNIMFGTPREWYRRLVKIQKKKHLKQQQLEKEMESW